MLLRRQSLNTYVTFFALGIACFCGVVFGQTTGVACPLTNAHNPFQEGVAGTDNCCYQQCVCNQRSSCCNDTWDFICVAYASHSSCTNLCGSITTGTTAVQTTGTTGVACPL